MGDVPPRTYRCLSLFGAFKAIPSFAFAQTRLGTRCHVRGLVLHFLHQGEFWGQKRQLGWGMVSFYWTALPKKNVATDIPGRKKKSHPWNHKLTKTNHGSGYFSKGPSPSQVILKSSTVTSCCGRSLYLAKVLFCTALSRLASADVWSCCRTPAPCILFACAYMKNNILMNIYIYIIHNT